MKLKFKLTRNLGSEMCKSIGLRGSPKDYVEGTVHDFDREDDVFKLLDKQGLVEEVRPEAREDQSRGVNAAATLRTQPAKEITYGR